MNTSTIRKNNILQSKPPTCEFPLATAVEESTKPCFVDEGINRDMTLHDNDAKDQLTR